MADTNKDLYAYPNNPGSNPASQLINQPFIWVNEKTRAFAYSAKEIDGVGTYAYHYTGYLNSTYTSGDTDYRNSIIFIKDTNEIWARGQFFGLSAESVATINTNFNTLNTNVTNLSTEVDEIQATYITTIVPDTPDPHTNAPFISGFTASKSGTTYKIKPTYSAVTLSGTKGANDNAVSNISIANGKDITITYAQVHTGTSTKTITPSTYTYLTTPTEIAISESGVLSYKHSYINAKKITYDGTDTTAGTKSVYDKFGEIDDTIASLTSISEQHLASTRIVWSNQTSIASTTGTASSQVSDTRAPSGHADYTNAFIEFHVTNQTANSDTYLYLPAEEIFDDFGTISSTTKDTLSTSISNTNGTRTINVTVPDSGISATKIIPTEKSIGYKDNLGNTTAYVKWGNSTNIEAVTYTLSQGITDAYLGNDARITSEVTTINTTLENSYLKKNYTMPAYNGTNASTVFNGKTGYVGWTGTGNGAYTYGGAIELLDRALGVAYTQLNTYITGVVKSVDGKTPNASGAVSLVIPTAITASPSNTLPNGETAYINIDKDISYYSAIETLDKAIKYAYEGARQYADSVATEAAALKWVVI